jgi:hypothetical protein
MSVREQAGGEMGTEESGGAGDEGDHYSAKIRKLVPPNRIRAP